MLLIFLVNIHGMLWETKKVVQLLMHFNQSGDEPNKIMVDKWSEFYLKSMKSWSYLKLVIMLEYQKVTDQIGQKVFVLKKIKIHGRP